MDMDMDTVNDLNDLLRDELSAIQTYRMAIDKSRKDHGPDTRLEKLTQMLHDHEQAAARLRELVHSMGGTAANDAGTWGTWATTVMGAARLLGDKAALRALKEGEESGIRDYRSALREFHTPEELEVFTANLLSEEEHVLVLDRMIQVA
jgi:bacterioferritin (cytochrome b1)